MIYRVAFEVESVSVADEGRPTHLVMWLGADSRDSAEQKARNIIRELPYLLANQDPTICACPEELLDDDSSPGLNALKREHERIARNIGLSLMLCVHQPNPN
jgi:hypothetical protein